MILLPIRSQLRSAIVSHDGPPRDDESFAMHHAKLAWWQGALVGGVVLGALGWFIGRR